jgi:hypothetical protein
MALATVSAIPTLTGKLPVISLGKTVIGENTVEVKVKVTNNGPYSGKDVVELYYSQPFYNDGYLWC